MRSFFLKPKNFKKIKRKRNTAKNKQMIKARPSKSFKITYHSNPFVTSDAVARTTQMWRRILGNEL